MLFNSYIFIFLFFPLCLLGFYGFRKVNSTWAKVWLIGFSLWFYGYFNIRYLCIMIFSILLNYGAYRLMVHAELVKSEGRAHEILNKKAILITGVSANLLLLFYFKYYDFFIENINAVFGIPWHFVILFCRLESVFLHSSRFRFWRIHIVES